MHLTSILPLIVPRAYFAHGNFPGYCLNLRHPELCVTWVDSSSPDTINYVPKVFFDEVGMTPEELHQEALLNLQTAGDLFTHEKLAGDQCVWRAMMHTDALGSSRLLLSQEIRAAFPDGCVVGLPDRSCAIVIALNASPALVQEAQALVRHCYEGATIPMLGDVSPLELFEIDQ